MKRTVILLLIFLPLTFAYHLGFFVPMNKLGSADDKQFGYAYGHALTIAIDRVNNDPSILPGHNLSYSWTDSTNIEDVLRAMYQKYISPPRYASANGTRDVKPVDVFIGPATNCSAPAKVSQAFNIPMISYYCSKIKRLTKNEYPLFVQTFQDTKSQAASTLFSLLKNQNWRRIGVLYEDGDPYWADFLQKILSNPSFEKIVRMDVPSMLKFGKYGYPFLLKPAMVERNESLAKVRDVLNDMKKKNIKIIVLLTSFNVLIEVMSEAHELGLTGTNKPHRAFIGFELDAKKRRLSFENPMFNSPYAEPVLNVAFRAMKAARSLLIISTSDPVDTEGYLKFRKELWNRTETQEPFREPSIYDAQTRDIDIAERATALYDAVYQYALALNRLHNNNRTVTAKSVVDEFRGHSYTGIGGFAATFTKQTGILKVRLSLLQLTEDIKWDANGRFLNKQAKMIGNFSEPEGNESLPSLKLSNTISWPWGTKHPTDQENCEDDGVDCPDENNDAYVYIIPSVISSVFIIIFFILMVLFIRQWRRERDLKRSVWQIDINQVIFDRKISTDSKFSDDSGIRTSTQELEAFALLDDCDAKDFFSNNNAISEDCSEILSLQSFSAVRSTSGSYKGDRVFVKILPKNVDITKPMQREFRMLRRIHQENLNPFIGVGIENNYLWIVMQLGSKGTLEEVLANPDITLDHRFILSLVYDIAKGMTFLHNSDVKSHGNLKSSNCVVDNRWVLKITDYGISGIRSRQARYMGPDNEDKKFRDLLWKAPELLRETDPPLCGTKKGDVYSFSIILEEFHTLRSPYSNSSISARNIVDRIVDGEVPPYRPVVTHPIENAERLLSLMKECWRETPEKRPSFQEIKYDVESAMNRCGLKTDICDNMITLLENYSSELEHVVSQRTRQLRDEKQKTDALLDRMLPRSVAEQLKRGETVQAESFSNVTVYFSDIVQFTALCAESTPMQVVDMLNDLYLLFDDIIMDYSVYKVETIGDAYMVVSGLPMRNGKLHASEISCMALEILDNVKKFKVGHKPNHELQIRIGIHTGPVVAGVVGMTMPRYCLFGDTVNTAARMESNGKELKIHVSGSTKEILEELGGFRLQKREGEVYLKGKGNCTTYWLHGASSDVPRCPRKLSKKAMKPLFQNSDSRKYSQPFRTRKKTQISFPRASVA